MRKEYLRQCEKWCIANVDGKCAVENCRVDIRMLQRESSDMDTAATLYNEAADLFAECFE